MALPTHRTAYGVKILNANHKEIRRLKREGHVAELHGNKFWNSSFLIMNYLKKNPLKKKSKNTRNWLRLGTIRHLLCERV